VLNACGASYSSWIFGEVKRTIQKYMKQIRAISSPGAELENVSVQSGKRRMGLRFFAGEGSLRNHQWHQVAANTVSHSRRANAVCERFLGSVRRECLDHFLIFDEKKLSRLLMSSVGWVTPRLPKSGLNPGRRMHQAGVECG